VTYLVAGSDILIMRHPEAIRLVKAFIDIAMDGGSAADIAPIAKRLEGVSVDLAALAPEPDLTIEEAKKAAKPAAKAAPKAAAKPAAPAAAPAEPAKPEKAAEAPVREIDKVAKEIGLDLEKLLAAKSCTREDIEHTAKQHNLTLEQTLKKLGGM
jgi:acetyl-CoA decarbonylase/synthase complex subunit delta